MHGLIHESCAEAEHRAGLFRRYLNPLRPLPDRPAPNPAISCGASPGSYCTVLELHRKPQGRFSVQAVFVSQYYRRIPASAAAPLNLDIPRVGPEVVEVVDSHYDAWFPAVGRCLRDVKLPYATPAPQAVPHLEPNTYQCEINDDCDRQGYVVPSYTPSTAGCFHCRSPLPARPRMDQQFTRGYANRQYAVTRRPVPLLQAAVSLGMV